MPHVAAVSSAGQVRYRTRAKVKQVMNFINFMHIENITIANMGKVNTWTPITNFIALIQLR